VPAEPRSRRATTEQPRASASLAVWLTVLLGVLCVIGLVMVGTASSVVSISYYGSPWAILLRECLWMVVGVAAFAFASSRSTPALRTLAALGLLASVALLALVLAPGFGTSSFGASRWLGFGWLRIQPSEFAKFALCLYAAHVIAKKERVETEWGRVLRPLAIVTLVAALLVLAQPDMGTAIVLLAIAFAVATAAGAPWRALCCTIGLLVVGCAIAAVALPYRRERLLTFLHPQADPSGGGYQLLQSKIGLGAGHLLGVGLGNSPLPWGYLPNPHTDFIFSIVGNELGFVGSVAVLGLLIALVLLGLRVATHAPDRFSQLAAVGISAWLATETIVNVGAVTGVLPVTGIPLPFISFGGTSLVIDMAAVGVLVGIARRSAAAPSLRVVASGRALRPTKRPPSRRVTTRTAGRPPVRSPRREPAHAGARAPEARRRTPPHAARRTPPRPARRTPEDTARPGARVR
jgi:cell division protein FtsW